MDARYAVALMEIKERGIANIKKSRLGGDPCGIDPRVDLGLDRLRSQKSTLDRSKIDSKIDT
jgi:hypothetical protein